MHQSVTEVEDGPSEPPEDANGRLCIKVSESIAGDYDTLPSEDELTVLYSAQFAVDYLFLFVKGMDRSGITLRLSPGKPLVLDYPLGCSKTDYVRFVLAPKLADS